MVVRGIILSVSLPDSIMMSDDHQSDYFGEDILPSIPEGTPTVVASGKPLKDEIAEEKNTESAQESYREELSDDKKVPKKERKTSNLSSGSVSDAIKGMLSFFTIFRLNVGEREIKTMEKKFCLVPIIGFIIGFIVAIFALILFELGCTSLLGAALVLATIFIITKFLHFDGLTDFGDGMIATGDREKHIRALKDTNIGAGGFGVAFIVTLISFAGLTEMGWMLVVLIWPIEVIVKNAMVSAAYFGEPGNGMAADQVRNTTSDSMVMSVIFTLMLAFIALSISSGLVYLFEDINYFTLHAMSIISVAILVAIALSLIVGMFMARTANKTFGYVNGDILGATNEIARAVIVVFSLIICGTI